jgi:hypothetical protein
MNDFLDQIDRALELRLYFVALFSALAVPDICGALEASDGRASKQAYTSWFDREMSGHSSGPSGGLDGEHAYYFRCSLLHQGTTVHPTSAWSRIIFVEPSSSMLFHGNRMNGALNIDLKVFCNGVTAAARYWLHKVGGTDPFETNSKNLIRRYADGLGPYIQGFPIIG